MESLSPRRPYMLRAFYDWILDNELTPHIVVEADWPGTEVPQEFVKDGQITLNVHPDALTGFQMGPLDLQFQARFNGVPRRIFIPYGALLAIYARENGAGTLFEPEPAYDIEAESLLPGEQKQGKLTSVESRLVEDDAKSEKTRKGRPKLKVIK